MISWKKISYNKLKAKQQERYNFAKVAALLADYGYICMWLDDDWNGADFVAIDTKQTVLKIQLKGRLNFQKKYQDKDLWICFPLDNDWYLYPHDELLLKIQKISPFMHRESWTKDGNCHWGSPSQNIMAEVTKYKIG